MGYRMTGLDQDAFVGLAELDEQGLAAIGARRVTAQAGGRYPCRVSLDLAKPGEELLLINYEHQPEPSSPYRAKGPIFVKVGAAQATYDNELPPPMRAAIVSLRAYDDQAMIVDAAVSQPDETESTIARLLERPDTAYIHAHYAGRGCFAARIDRA